MLSTKLRVAWSIAAWELCIDRRGDLGLPERHILSREIRNVERRVPEIGMDITHVHHLAVARPLLQKSIDEYKNSRYGLGPIYGSILAESLDRYVLEQGYSKNPLQFVSERKGLSNLG